MTYRTYSIYPVRVNAVAAGLSTDTVTYSIYPNPYITINGNRWTKHYYIGSERVASRTGTIMGGFNGLHDMDSDVAGSTLQIPVNYDSMCATEEDSIASMYERFGVPYEVQHANSRGQVAHMYFPITRTDSEDNTAETSGEKVTAQPSRHPRRGTGIFLPPRPPRQHDVGDRQPRQHHPAGGIHTMG